MFAVLEFNTASRASRYELFSWSALLVTGVWREPVLQVSWDLRVTILYLLPIISLGESSEYQCVGFLVWYNKSIFDALLALWWCVVVTLNLSVCGELVTFDRQARGLRFCTFLTP